MRANFVRVPRAAARAGHLRRDRDARRGADRRGAAASSPSAASRPTVTSSRCCSACARTARDELVRAGHRLRVYVPFGDALVRVLGAAAAGEPEDRRLRRRRHASPGPASFAGASLQDLPSFADGSKAAQREAAVDDERLAADHLGVGRAEERDGAGDVFGLTSRPTGLALPAASISSRFGKCSSAPVSTTPAETALTRIARRELDGEVADERLERRLRCADQRRSSRARAASRATRSRRSTRRRGICGAATRASASSARAFAFIVQSQCLSSVSSAGRITPVAALCTSTSSGPSAATSLEHAVAT